MSVPRSSVLRGTIARLVRRLRRRQLDEGHDDEVREHLRLLADQFQATGMSRSDAELAARRQFGNTTQLREDRAAVLAVVPRVLADMARDVRRGLRTLSRTPAFSMIVVLTFGLGIGANTAILSIVNGVVLRPLSYPNPAQLMYIDASGTGAAEGALSVPEYLEFRQFNTSFSHVGAFRMDQTNFTLGRHAVRVRAAVVDASLMQVLGVRPLDGRLFSTEETEVATKAPVAIISYGLWQSAFGGQAAVGQTVDLGGRRAEVIGILPGGIDLMDNRAEVWLPLSFLREELALRNNHNLHVIGRLKDGVTSDVARAEVLTLEQTWATKANVPLGATGHAGHVLRPPSADGNGHFLRLTPLDAHILGPASRSIWVLQAAAVLLLVIACANVANLLLVRAASRQREFAVMAALGGGRAAVLRKGLTESLLLAIAGCALGIALAHGALGALIRTYPDSLPRMANVSIDPWVLLASLGLAIGCGLIFGLAPMLHMRPIVAMLKVGGRGTSGVHHRLRRGLVVAEIALAIVVAIGAGLLVRSLHNLTAVDPGFRRDQLLTFSLTLPLETHNARTALVGVASAARSRTYQRIVDRLRAIPGIRDASAMTLLPLDRPVNGNNTEIADPATQTGIDYPRVMSRYFETMGTPIVQGRSFASTDITSGAWVTVVNEALATTVWRGQNPIGKRLRPSGTKEQWFTVIGVAQDVKQASLDRAAEPEAYILVDQFVTDSPTTWVAFSPATMHLVLRTTLPLSSLTAPIRAAVGEIDPTVPVAGLREMDDVVNRTLERPRLLAQLLAAFGGLALVLAAVGTYGVLAFMVTERRRDMGIRLALGATRNRVLWQVIMQGLATATIGVGVGLIAAIGLTRLLTSVLFNVPPTDPWTLASVVMSTVLIVVLASWIPAWRASRFDPNVVLRVE